jgi:hypothetical protein
MQGEKQGVGRKTGCSHCNYIQGTVSLPFEIGENKKGAIRIIDDKRIESLKIVELS